MRSKLPEMGKISPEIFEELIYPRLGARDKEILVGPQNGVDVGIVEIGGKAVALTTDPVFIVPEYGWERAAWFAVHILASDLVTSGLPPKYLSIDLNLPMEITEAQLERVWETIHGECQKLGISIICGHTARYENCHYPMVGGATLMAVGPMDGWVTPRMALAGDRIIVTKGPAIEASGIFAAIFPELLADRFGEDFSQRAQKLFYQMSVVKDALTAVKVGVRDKGVTAMHDATECGVWGGIHELAQAAGLGVRVEKEKIPVDEKVEKICGLFEIDLYKSISEGTLIIACKEERAADVVNALASEGIISGVVGKLTPPDEGMILISEGGEEPLVHPRVDPFWQAFYQALRGEPKGGSSV